MPVSGVRTSWANAASAASTMPGLGSVLARARGPRVFAATFETRFFDGRLLAGREVRRTRDFAAMIPVNPARLPAWHARATGVTVTFLVYQPQTTAVLPGGEYRQGSLLPRAIRASRWPCSI